MANETDPMQVLYHVRKVMEERGQVLKDIQADIGQIKIDVAVIKQAGVGQIEITPSKKTRVQDGGIITAIIGGLIAVFEILKAKGIL